MPIFRAPKESDELKKWSSQIRKGSLEMCLLGIIGQKPRYGFEIVQQMVGDGGPLVSEGTLYPLLNRLQNEALIEASWQESANGPPRKYYHLTEKGRAIFERMRDEWRTYAATVENILLDSEAPREAPGEAKRLEVTPKTART